MDYDQDGVTKRILLAASLVGLTDTELAKEIGVQRQFIVSVKNRISCIPAKRAIIFLRLHKEIDARWLFFDEGEMMVKPSTDGKHSFFISEKGEMEFTSAQVNNEEVYQRKYKSLQDIIKEKDNHIKGLEKTLVSQNEFIDKLMSKL